MKHVVEQHFDDCCEDLSSIVDEKQLQHHSAPMDDFPDTEAEPDDEPDLENRDVHVYLQAGLLGSDAAPAQWAQRQRTYEASDLAELGRSKFAARIPTLCPIVCSYISWGR